MKILNLIDQSKSDIKYLPQKFPDGQQNIIIDKNTIFNPTSEEPIQIKSRLNNWLDLELLICTVASLKQLGVEEIHLYVPYIIGARSDRDFTEGNGGNNYLKDVICPIINSLNFKSVTCIDPHSDVLEACIKGFRKEFNLHLQLIKYFFNENYPHAAGFDLDRFILISPDAGATKKIYKLAEQIGYKGDIITCNKDRDANGKLIKTVVPITKEHLNKDLIIIDDICDGGATFINIAKEIKKLPYFRGKIYLIVTHGIFSKGFEELSIYFDSIYCTNSYGQLESNEMGDSWIGTSEVQYWPEIPKNLVKQLDIF